ncbi:MAG: hypothetical protein NTW29_13085 [Bacteroidetes bacterium]|nr:hypothetical protein [Bacteroidota bacterium]
MLTKKQVLSAIKEMPDTFEATALFDRLVLFCKIEEGREDSKKGRSFTTAEVKKQLKKWRP